MASDSVLHFGRPAGLPLCPGCQALTLPVENFPFSSRSTCERTDFGARLVFGGVLVDAEGLLDLPEVPLAASWANFVDIVMNRSVSWGEEEASAVATDQIKRLALSPGLCNRGDRGRGVSPRAFDL